MWITTVTAVLAVFNSLCTGFGHFWVTAEKIIYDAIYDAITLVVPF